MSQQFNPKRVLRQISKPLLREFFERQGHPLDVKWDRLSNMQVDDIFDAWQGLPDAQRKAVEIVFHDVHEMANDDNGTRVIIEEGQYHGEDLSPLLEPMESRYDTPGDSLPALRRMGNTLLADEYIVSIVLIIAS